MIFLEMTRMLNIGDIDGTVRLKSFGFERIDGNIQGNERQNAIDRFNAENLLISLCF